MRITATDTIRIKASGLVWRLYHVIPPRVFDGSRTAAWSIDDALERAQEMVAAHRKTTRQELAVAIEDYHACDANRFVDVRR